MPPRLDAGKRNDPMTDKEAHEKITEEMCKRFELMLKERDQLRAENLQMRQIIEHAIAIGYIGEGSTFGSFEEALKLPHTAHLARKIELMEKVIERARIIAEYPNGPSFDSLKELDDHIAKGKNESP